jgi:hypothetical protein
MAHYDAAEVIAHHGYARNSPSRSAEEIEHERFLRQAWERQYRETHQALCVVQAELETANRELARVRESRDELERATIATAEIHRVELEHRANELIAANQKISELEQLQRLSMSGFACA